MADINEFVANYLVVCTRKLMCGGEIFSYLVEQLATEIEVSAETMVIAEISPNDHSRISWVAEYDRPLLPTYF